MASSLRHLTRTAAQSSRLRAVPQTSSRFASTVVPAAHTNYPPVSPAKDPQLAGLNYPDVPEVNRQGRPAKAGWWDEQDRWNKGEPVGRH